MCNELFKRKIIVQVMAVVVLMGMTCPVFAIDHWWHGGASNNLNDPANWTDRNASTEPTTPTGSPRDIVRIGGSWDSEDLNGNGVLDEGEDLNGNDIIDDPNPGFGVGYGGYHGSGGGIELAVNPVLNTTYVSRSGGAEGGWWFVLNAPNILTLKDGAFLIMSEANCNLRNGGRLEVQGRSNTGGPSLITAGSFRVAENGAIAEAAHETSQVRINGTGYMQVDASLEGDSGEQSTWFRIGTSDPPGTMPRGEIIIEDQGRLELLSADPAPYIQFGNADPSVNQIILRDEGELWLPGDPATIGRVGPGETVTSLEDMIAMGLITGDEGSILAVSGVNPTVVRVAKKRISNPSPSNGASEVATEVVLGWDAGTFGTAHDVYFGTDPVDVNDADRDNPLDVLKNQDQVEIYYPLDGTLSLDYDQSYFWRVDEVNATEGNIYTGDVWSFTVEPFARAISAGDIIATASSQAEGQGPENTINGSGLVDELHSTVLTDMWSSQSGEPGSEWIQYEFSKVYKLHEMLVWNYNGQSLLSAVGLKDVVVEYSTDGANWTQIDSVSVFNKASGTDDYASNTTVPFGGVSVKYVKISASSNWGGGFVNQYGLSEVRFLYIPVSARMPVPEDGATDVAINVTLVWRSGREASEHNVYIGEDIQAVIDGTVPVETVSETSYGPLSLDLGSAYYWRVDEVNNAATTTWPGDVWSFTTQQYLVVDDFESYNDIPEGEEGSNLVYATWIDGYNNPTTNGSTVGYVTGKSLETTIVHGGNKSVPVMYDNSVASLSEITTDTSDLNIGRDWTIGAPATLSLWFYGSPDNPTTEQMYVKVNNAKVMYDGDLTQADWQEFTVDLVSLGIDLSSVTSVTIGFERTGATGDSGMVFIDDIWLYAPLNN